MPLWDRPTNWIGYRAESNGKTESPKSQNIQHKMLGEEGKENKNRFNRPVQGRVLRPGLFCLISSNACVIIMSSSRRKCAISGESPRIEGGVIVAERLGLGEAMLLRDKERSHGVK